jgi:hypothetical protein
MLLESYVQALITLIKDGKLTVDQIKDPDYKAEVERRLASTQ